MSNVPKQITAVVGVLAGCLLAMQAQATPINVTGFAYGSTQASIVKPTPPGPVTVNAGAFSATIGGNSYVAWCADIFQTITLPGTYDFTYAAGSSVFSAAVNQKLGVLATGALGLVDNSLKSAAFQLAVWEILYEGVTNLALASDDFIATSAAAGEAQSWLNEINEGFWTANHYTIDVWQSGRTQDLIVFRKVPVPEPASLAILAIGFVLVAVTAARQRRGAADRL
ncbi:MAG: PEP-CTERM sorting domain-containing protein [Chromatiales bacterium]|jgi:hypothetical protein|nr:PEP-CTERM sorting domain-containing protein [Chromatiales bacterium]